MDSDSARGERQRDPPGADSKLERCAATRELREEVDGSPDDIWMRGGRVLAQGERDTTLAAENIAVCFGLPLEAARQLGR